MTTENKGHKLNLASTLIQVVLLDVDILPSLQQSEKEDFRKMANDDARPNGKKRRVGTCTFGVSSLLINQGLI